MLLTVCLSVDSAQVPALCHIVLKFTFLRLQILLSSLVSVTLY